MFRERVYERRAADQCWVPETPAKEKRNCLIGLIRSIDVDSGDASASIVPQVLEFSEGMDDHDVEFFNVTTTQESEANLPESKKLLLPSSDGDKNHYTINSSPASCVSDSSSRNTDGVGENVAKLQSGTSTQEFCVPEHVQQNVPEKVEAVVQHQEDEGVKSVKKGIKRGPKQKPKRKKHKPRVVVVGNPKIKKTPQRNTPKKPRKAPRQPKTPVPDTPMRVIEAKTGKRKYVRKNVEEKPRDGDVVDESVSKKRKCARGNNRSNPGSSILVPPPPVPIKTCRQALNFDLENESRDDKAIEEAIPASEACLSVDECAIPEALLEFGSHVPVDESVNTSKLCGYRKPRSRRRRLNTLFMRNLPVCQVHGPSSKRRLRRATRRCDITLLTAIPVCSQLPKLPSKRASPIENATLMCCQLPELPPLQAAASEKEDADTNNLDNSIAGSNKIEPYVIGELKLHRGRIEGNPFENKDIRMNGILTDVGLEKVLPEPGVHVIGGSLRVLQEPGVGLQDGLGAFTVFSQEYFQRKKIGAPPLFLEQKNDSLTPHLGHSFRVVAPSHSHRTGAMEILPRQDVRFPEQIISAVEPLSNQSEGALDLSPRQAINSQEMPASKFLKGHIMLCPDQLQKQMNACSSQQVLQEQNPAIQKKSLKRGNLRLTAKSRDSQEIVQMGRKKMPPQTRPPRPSRASQVEMLQQQKPPTIEEITSKFQALTTKDGGRQLMRHDNDGRTEDPIDDDMKDWMQKEREVFEGRIKLFTSKMHLFMGDRRFKPWKGSVLDSVIGVYLTQNTFDYLSSSAFMSLVSNFPSKSTCNHTASYKYLRVTDGQESLGMNSRSDGAVYDSEGNKYYVTQPEPDRCYDLQYGGDSFDSRTQGKPLPEIEGWRDMKDAVVSQTFGTCSIQCLERSQLSPTGNTNADVSSPGKTRSTNNSQFSPTGNLKAELTPPSKASCVESSVTASAETLHPENMTFLQDTDKINKILFCDECLDGCTTPTMMDNGCQASPSGRNEMKIDFGSVSSCDSDDPHAMSVSSLNQGSSTTGTPESHNASTTRKKRTEREASKIKESTASVKKDGTKKTTRKKKNNNKERQDWDLLRRTYSNGAERSPNHMDSVDWEAVRCAEETEIAQIIEKRGQQNNIAKDIKNFLNRIFELHGTLDLEWLRNVPPDKVKEYLLDIKGIGLKSTECIRLLSLEHGAFPVDVNVARIAVRLGWVPLQPLPGDLHIHMIEKYPSENKIQKYLWPRLCVFDHETLYELHYHMITFGKVFCKSTPNCGPCPLRGECKYYASAVASGALPGPSEKGIVASEISNGSGEHPPGVVNPTPVIPIEADPVSVSGWRMTNCEPIVEEPQSPEPDCAGSVDSMTEDNSIHDIEDILTIRLQERELKTHFQTLIEMNNMMVQNSDALVALTVEAASRPVRKQKSFARLRTDHLVYELPDDHPILLQGKFERRDPDDECPYLLVVWFPGDTPNSVGPARYTCNSEDSKLCDSQICFRCNNIREVNAGIARGTILIPCRTANGGRFPLNGTYFQVNEVFADHETSICPLDVPRHLIANLRRRTVCFGGSVGKMFHGSSLPAIQFYFWEAFVCVRGFDRRYRCPRPLTVRLHCSTTSKAKAKRIKDA